jgi:formylglycine-generating enzyme required for sulfatase activity
MGSLTREEAVLRDRLRLDASGRSRCGDSATILDAAAALIATGDSELVNELLVSGFLRDSGERYERYIKWQMQSMPGASFAMGTDEANARHFCGESPRHVVSLSPYTIGAYPVTNELFGLLDRRADLPARERHKPVVDVTWFDAALFAMWVGCRLPTEAEWEYVCAAEGEGEWCCEDESDLRRYAWYSENSRGELRPVGMRKPSRLGVFDMHGNVWEWCEDDYDARFYERSPSIDPVCRLEAAEGRVHHKVSRGGSVHSLAEMCRTCYRLHEAPDFSAFDLGFRLARDAVADDPGA